MTTTAQLDPTTSIEVEIGVPLGGKLRTWDGTKAQTWTVDDIDLLTTLSGTGAVFSAPVSQGHYREVGMLDAESGLLCLSISTPVSKLHGILQSCEHFTLTPAPENATSEDELDKLWEAFERHLMSAFTHAVDRRELLVVGGRDDEGPSITLGTMTKDLRVSAIVSAAPAPISPGWPDPEPDALDRTSIISPMLPMTPLEHAYFTTTALQAWGISPHDAVITTVVPIEVMTVALPWDLDETGHQTGRFLR